MGSFRHQRQSGFTLIELVIVIVIIGILAAVAIPKYADLAKDAKLAKVNGIAGSFNSAATANFAICSAKLVSCKLSGNVPCSTEGANALLNAPPTDVTYSGLDTACTVADVGDNTIVSSPSFVIPQLTTPAPPVGQ